MMSRSRTERMLKKAFIPHYFSHIPQLAHYGNTSIVHGSGMRLSAQPPPPQENNIIYRSRDM